MKKIFSVLAVISLLIANPFAALASGEGTSGDYASGMGVQFVRGLGNILSSPAEIPCTMSSDISEKGGVGVATGFGKGLAFMLRRIVVGVSEVGTFILPAPPVLPTVCTSPAKPQV